MPSRKSALPVAQWGAPHAHHAHHPHHARPIELDAGDAFVPDYRRGFVPSADDEAEAFGEEFIASATSAEAVAESARDEVPLDEPDALSDEPVEDGDE